MAKNNYIVLKDDLGFCGLYKNGLFLKSDYDITEQKVIVEYDLQDEEVICKDLTEADNRFMEVKVFSLI